MIRFLDFELALEIHCAAIELTTGQSPSPSDSMLRDRNVLESAVYAPQQHYFYGGIYHVPRLAAILCLRIAMHHPFVDGNKRSAVAAMAAFLQMNGFCIRAERQMEIYQLLIDAIIEKIDEEAFCDAIDDLVMKLPPPE